MNCRACQELLQQRLDRIEINRPAAEQSAIEQHLQTCSDCRLQLRAIQRLEEGLSVLPRPVPPALLTSRIVQSLMQDRQRRNRLRFRTYAVMALAASVVLVVSLVSLRGWLFPTPVPMAPALTEVVQTQPPEVVAPPASQDLRETVAEAGSAVVALTSRTADATVDQTRRLLPLMPTATLSQIDLTPSSPLEPATDSLRQTGTGVAAGFEPVTNSARRAVDLFLRDLPPMGLIEKSGL